MLLCYHPCCHGTNIHVDISMSFETISLYVIEEVFHLQGINATDSIKMEKREESSSDTENECSENHDWIWEKLVIISCYNDRFVQNIHKTSY